MPIKKTPQQRLVPPPPPVTPSFLAMQPPIAGAGLMMTEQPAFMPAQGMQMPRLDFGRPQVNIPALPVDELSALNKPVDMTGLRDLRNKQVGILDNATQAANSPQPFMPDLVQQDPITGRLMAAQQADAFHQFMSDNIKQSLLNEMASGPSRFDQGFNTGQQIAANIVTPLIGLFGGGGTAAGANVATQELKAEVLRREQMQKQQKREQNQTLINLTQLYDGLDPNSAKNISSLISKQIEINQARNNQRRQLQQDVAKATADLADTEGKLIQGERSDRDRKMKTILDMDSHDMRAAELQAQLGNQNASDSKATYDILEKAAQNGADNKLKQEKQALDVKEFDLKQANSRNEVLAKLGNTIRQMTAAATTTSGGALKNPGYAQAIASNPALAKVFAQQMKAAGLEGLKPEDVFSAFSGESAPQAPESPDLFAGLGGAMNQAGAAVANVGKSIFGGAEPKQQTVEFAKVIKAPNAYLDLQPEQIQMVKSRDAAIVPLITQRLKSLGHNPTPKDVTEILNKLSGGRK